MKTVFPAVLTIHHFRCGVKEADPICGANFLPWSLYVQKWNGNTILPTSQNIAYVIVTIHVHLLPEKNLRAYPGVERGSQEWEDTYKIRVNVEKSINHFKDSFCIADRKTQNEKTLHADLLLAGITQLVTVLVADKIHQYQYIRSLKPLIAWLLICIQSFLRSLSGKSFSHVQI